MKTRKTGATTNWGHGRRRRAPDALAKLDPLLPAPDRAKLDLWIVQSKKSGSGKTSPQEHITASEYGTLQDAYDFLNLVLFGGCLPEVFITLQHHHRALGYFSPQRFQQRGDSANQVHEVALNPDGFAGNTDEGILSILCHEMAHVWQKEFGHPGRSHYHNREWARKLFSLGLMPSSTAEPGGAVTGDHMSHYILRDGLFHAACAAFLERYQLRWESAAEVPPESGTPEGDGSSPVPPATPTLKRRSAKRPTRAKFGCPNCHKLNVWAKPGALIDCHVCSMEARELVLLVEQE